MHMRIVVCVIMWNIYTGLGAYSCRANMLTPDSRTVFQTACICTKHVRKCTSVAATTVTSSKRHTAVHDLEQLGEIIVPHVECSAL